MRRNAAPYGPLRVWFRSWLRLKRSKVVTLVTVPSRDGVDGGVGQSWERPRCWAGLGRPITHSACVTRSGGRSQLLPSAPQGTAGRKMKLNPRTGGAHSLAVFHCRRLGSSDNDRPDKGTSTWLAAIIWVGSFARTHQGRVPRVSTPGSCHDVPGLLIRRVWRPGEVLRRSEVEVCGRMQTGIHSGSAGTHGDRAGGGVRGGRVAGASVVLRRWMLCQKAADNRGAGVLFAVLGWVGCLNGGLARCITQSGISAGVKQGLHSFGCA